jgi:hypothetical protein
VPKVSRAHIPSGWASTGGQVRVWVCAAPSRGWGSAEGVSARPLAARIVPRFVGRAVQSVRHARSTQHTLAPHSPLRPARAPDPFSTPSTPSTSSTARLVELSDMHRGRCGSMIPPPCPFHKFFPQIFSPHKRLSLTLPRACPITCTHQGAGGEKTACAHAL